MRAVHRASFWLACALWVGCDSSPSETESAQTGQGTPPIRNVVLITLDTTRADHLGVYGYSRPTSPNLDRLATQGVVFDHAISQASVTPVAHASLLTGLDPYHHGLRVLHGLEGNALAESQVTLAEVWGRRGGESAAFVSAYPAAAAFGLHQGFDVFDEEFAPAEGPPLVSPSGRVNTGLAQRRADVTTDAVLKWLDGRVDRRRALFLWVHYFDPHDPFVLPPQRVLDLFSTPGEERAERLIAVYDAELRFMDLQIGRLLAALSSRGYDQDSVVAVIADHGEGLGDHDWWSHGVLYQEQIRVPFVLRAPGLASGTRVASLVRGIDLAPTLLEATGTPRALWPQMDGQSLWPALFSQEPFPELTAYADSVNRLRYGRFDDPDRMDDKRDRLYSLVRGDVKVILHELDPGKNEAYDLARDPAEQNNLAGAPTPEMTLLLERIPKMGALSTIEPGETDTPVDREDALRALGYVE